MSEMRLREALSLGLTEALDNDERVVLLGEDIGKYQGSYAVTRSLYSWVWYRICNDRIASNSGDYDHQLSFNGN